MTTFVTLSREVATSHGIYAPGVQVVRLGQPKPGKVRICLDQHGIHLGTRCHAATVPAAWVEGLPFRSSRLSQADRTDLVHAVAGHWSRHKKAA